MEKLWLALRRGWKRYRDSFVYRKELRGWPTVRHVAPGYWRLIAWHTGPRRVQDRGGYKPPVLTGIALGALYFFVYSNFVAWHSDVLMNAAVFGVICIFASIPFWKLARKTRLVMKFDDGVISWKSPDGERQRYEPDGYEIGLRLMQHRWGPEEVFKHGEFMRRNPGAERPKPLFQEASELIMTTGRDGAHWRTVAEFCNDQTGEDAGRLKSAIELVIEKVIEEQQGEAKAAAQTGSL